MTEVIFVVFYIYFQSFLLNLPGPPKYWWSTNSTAFHVIFCHCFCRARCLLPSPRNSHPSRSPGHPQSSFGLKG